MTVAQRETQTLEARQQANGECAPGSAPVQRLPERELVARLEQSTALVLVLSSGSGFGIGTGFFVAENLLVTNRHVVEDARRQPVLVLSRSMGRPVPADVVLSTVSSEVGDPDLALLRLREGRAPGVLPLAASANKLAEVVAAGYPGLVIESDAGFNRLLEGDLRAAPDLNITKGTVQSLQSTDAGVPLILHTANIAKGNSGGPLVDRCGRVVGVNTFINVDSAQSARVNYALAGSLVSRFLKQAGSSSPLDERACDADSSN